MAITVLPREQTMLDNPMLQMAVRYMMQRKMAERQFERQKELKGIPAAEAPEQAKLRESQAEYYKAMGNYLRKMGLIGEEGEGIRSSSRS